MIAYPIDTFSTGFIDSKTARNQLGTIKKEVVRRHQPRLILLQKAINIVEGCLFEL